VTPYTLEFVFKTPQRRVFSTSKRAYVEEEDGGLVATLIAVKEPGWAHSARLEGYTDDAGMNRMHVVFRLGRDACGAWEGAFSSEGVVFNGKGYIQAGLHENEHTEERLLYTLAELFDWNGVVVSRSTT